MQTQRFAESGTGSPVDEGVARPPGNVFCEGCYAGCMLQGNSNIIEAVQDAVLA